MLNDSNSKIILFASGFGGGAQTVLSNHLVRFFSSRGFSVFPLMFSESKNNFSDLSMKQYCKVIHNKLKEVGQGKHVVFVGHSLGATIFLEYIRTSGIVNYSIVLLDPSMPESFRPWFDGYMKLDKDKKSYNDSVNNLQISTNLYNELLNFNTIESIKKVKRRVLVIVAERGAISYGNEIHQKVRNAETHIVKATGHLFGLYKARIEVFSLITQFLKIPVK